ncbi:unnamed protein product [Prorocentrum cordatum]|uniref:STI1/HOP DP domain-containing protein n=1 Tax=Prorocentrum cordatum TaxID=2364126 RepID=A0ABN9QCW8_9DINO|nr:unnamed protein product [Polarella glacialis]
MPSVAVFFVLALALGIAAFVVRWYLAAYPRRVTGAGGGPFDPKVQAAIDSDPELRKMMEDIKTNGPSAAQKYFGNEELMVKMSRISAASGQVLGAPGSSRVPAAEPAGPRDEKQELRRRAQKDRRTKASQGKSAAQIAAFEKQRDKDDAEAWEAMQREMAELESRK